MSLLHLHPPAPPSRRAQNDPAAMASAIARVRAYEQASGFSWQQRGPIDELIAAEPAPRYRQQLLLPTD
ncbi:hypothetical protein [Chloroflexus sp.]|uniref:hypothetical protein n=1 Tax=Chloroflexus sp. TaxID=1904827 RepID=UPI002ACE0CAC|nr:hypothetical protein [Chloroflexus sp.]